MQLQTISKLILLQMLPVKMYVMRIELFFKGSFWALTAFIIKECRDKGTIFP